MTAVRVALEFVLVLADRAVPDRFADAADFFAGRVGAVLVTEPAFLVGAFWAFNGVDLLDLAAFVGVVLLAIPGLAAWTPALAGLVRVGAVLVVDVERAVSVLDFGRVFSGLLGLAATFDPVTPVALAAFVGVVFGAGRLGRAVFAVDLATGLADLDAAFAAGFAALLTAEAFAAFDADAGFDAGAAFETGLVAGFAVPDFLPTGFCAVGFEPAGLAVAGFDFFAAGADAVLESTRAVVRRSDVLAAAGTTRRTSVSSVSGTTGMSTPLVRRNAWSGRQAPVGAKITRKGRKDTSIQAVAASDHTDPRGNRAPLHRAFPDLIGE